jgi:hypothetical protein
MLAKNCEPKDVMLAATMIGVQMAYTPYRAEGGFRFRLKPVSDNKRHPWKRFPYWRTSAAYRGRGRTVCAVCWHGHREFFRKLFEIAPNAKVLTAQTRRAGFRYYTAENFEECYEDTDVNIGPPIAPMYFSEACHCQETMTVMVPQGAMTSECWLIQFRGHKACDDCEFVNTDECGGPEIRKTGMNEKGFVVPIREGSVNLSGPRKQVNNG